MISNVHNALFLLLTIQSTSGLITVTNKLTKQVAFTIPNHDFVPYNSDPVKTKTFIVLADPPDGCTRIKSPPNLNSIYERRDDDQDKIDEPNWVLFVPVSSGCGVDEKILTAQRFNYSGIILQKGGYFESDLPAELRTQPDPGYHINVSFVSEADGNILSQSYVFPKKKLIYTVEMVENQNWSEYLQSVASDAVETLIGFDRIHVLIRGCKDLLEWVTSSPYRLAKWASRKKLLKITKNLGNFLVEASLLCVPVLFLYYYHYVETRRRNPEWSGYVPPRYDRTYGSYGQSDEETDHEYGNRNNKPDIFRCHQLLELEEGATEDDIKKSYHRLARLYHSDKTSGQDEDVRKHKEDKFKEINQAKTILLEALQKRGIY